MAVIPTSYLPPESQPWGRSVDERIGNLETLVGRMSQETNNTLLQLGSSVQLLSLQVADVQESVQRLGELAKSTSATTNGFSRVTNGSTTNLGAMPSITLNLDRASRVLVTGSARILGDAGNSSTTPLLQAILSWQTNYAPSAVLCGCSYLNQIIPPSGQIVRGNASISSSEVISVPAGTLTISPLQAFIELNGGGGGNAIIQASPITISAIVLPQ